jgi:hypothetical protein
MAALEGLFAEDVVSYSDEIDRRLHARPFRLRHRWVGAKQIASYVGAGSVRGIQR